MSDADHKRHVAAALEALTVGAAEHGRDRVAAMECRAGAFVVRMPSRAQYRMALKAHTDSDIGVKDTGQETLALGTCIYPDLATLREWIKRYPSLPAIISEAASELVDEGAAAKKLQLGSTPTETTPGD